MKKHTNLVQVAKKLISEQLIALEQLKCRIDDSFQNVIEVIHNNPGRLIVIGLGKSGIIGRKIVATLNSTGTLSSFVHASDALHGDLGNISNNDIVLFISKSGNTAEIKQLIPIVKSMGLTIVAMTGNLNSHLAVEADFILDVSIEKEACPNDLAPTTSTTSQLVMGDALAVSLLSLKNFSKEDFAKLHPGGILGNKLHMAVEQLCDPVNKPTVYLDDTIKTIIMEISSKRLGATAVIENGTPVGIITDGDLRRMLHKDLNNDQILAKDLMTISPKTINKTCLVNEALSIMKQYSITQLLVTHEEQYVGIIHLHDILKSNFF